MADVIEIGKARKVWVPGPVRCGACGFAAQSVYPAGEPGFKPWGLPCPSCGLATLVALDEALEATPDQIGDVF